jgi:hypothetical protein
MRLQGSGGVSNRTIMRLLVCLVMAGGVVGIVFTTLADWEGGTVGISAFDILGSAQDGGGVDATSAYLRRDVALSLGGVVSV